MGSYKNFSSAENKYCSRWSDFEFVNYCLNGLGTGELAELDQHLSQCSDCRERFMLCWNVLTSESSPEDLKEDLDLLSDTVWKQQKIELARKHADAVEQHFGQVPSSPVEDIPMIVKRKRGGQPFGVTALKIAAMLLVALVPVVLTYNMVINPLLARRNTLPAQNVQAEEMERLSPELAEMAVGLEQVGERLESEPDALLERAAYQERFLLFEQAQKSYERYLSLDSGSARRSDAEARYKALAERLANPPAVSATRYEQLDKQIDGYLDALVENDLPRAKVAMTAASHNADEMAAQTGDLFGLDLVSFYRAQSRSAIEELRGARRLRSEADNLLLQNRFPDVLLAIEEQKSIFRKFGADCEQEQTDIQFFRYLTKLNSLPQAAELFSNRIDRADSKKHLFSLAQFKHYQGTYYYSISDFENSRKSFEEAIQIAGKLDVPKFLTKISMNLAAMYHTSNQNAHAFELAYQTLRAARATDDSFRMLQLSQILAMSAFSLRYPSLAESYIESSISLAEKRNDLYSLSLSHAYLGIIRTEQGRPAEAETAFSRATGAVEAIADPNFRAVSEFYVTGYNARSQMVAGNSSRAMTLYQHAIDLGQTAGIKEKLLLGQLHQGLGESLKAQGDNQRASLELSIAADLEKQGRANSEQYNNLLSFAPIRNTNQK